MLINWFTVVAQIINFLILVALLRWFLYQPILQVMQKRQNRLEQQWQAVETARTEAQQTIDQYQHKQDHLAQQQQDLLAQARGEAEQERQRLFTETRQEIAAQRHTWQENWYQEKAAFLRTLRQQIIHQTLHIARQALTNLAHASLEQQIIQVFCDRLTRLDPEKHAAIGQALTQNDDLPLQIISHFEIPVDLRQQVIDTLQSQWDCALSPQFVTDRQLLCGIQLKLAGQEVCWNLDTYLQNLEQRLADAMNQH
ncbi:MAG: F0F1 ATP synthase subunit B [Synechocystis sp.]|nr:F0F1 ATP synthase subunit B [Synechocystis sp.]